MYVMIIVAIPVISELIRIFIEGGVKNNGTVEVIPGLFSLVYSENRGVAFGLFQDGTVFFSIATAIVIVVFSIFLIKNYKKSKLFSVAASPVSLISSSASSRAMSSTISACRSFRRYATSPITVSPPAPYA